MNILLLQQGFYPDVVASAQYCTDLAVGLAARGHGVTVMCSARAYDDPTVRFPRKETWKNIRVIRIPTLGLGRGSKWMRIADFAGLMLGFLLRAMTLPKQDLVIAMTVPPLVSYIGALLVRIRGGRLLYWVMDLNPDEAIAAGWMRPTSLVARLLEAASLYSMKVASQIVVLDRYMQQRIVNKGISAHKVSVVPPWSLDNFVQFDAEGRQRFRRANAIGDRFVVMYSGNHSPCHPLDPVVEAAQILRDRDDIVFYFIGGGSEWAQVKAFRAENKLSNICALPYQPLGELSASLSAADLHVVVMGSQYVGIVHPCKIYNILAVGRQFLYVGPKEGHIPDLVADREVQNMSSCAEPGDAEGIANIIRSAINKQVSPAKPAILEQFSRENLLRKMWGLIECEAIESGQYEPAAQVERS